MSYAPDPEPGGCETMFWQAVVLFLIIMAVVIFFSMGEFYNVTNMGVLSK